MKRFFTFTLSLLLPALLFAQNKALLMPGGKVSSDDARIIKNRVLSSPSFNKITPFDNLQGVAGTLDTLAHAPWDQGGNWGTTFGYSGQDVMLQWFEAPADMLINAIYFVPSEFDDDQVSVKLVNMNWTKEQIQNAGVTYWGYYSAEGNNYNDLEPFIENDHGVTVTDEDWVDVEGSGLGSPVGTDLWSDGGFGAPVTTTVQQQEWVEMSLLGFSPEVKSGDIFGVVVKNTNPDFTSTVRAALLADNTLGITGFKFYANGRLVSGGPGVGDPGWWTRNYSWNIGVAVDLIGDRAPVIESYTQLVTTLSTADRTVEAVVTDDNPSGGNAGVASVKIIYSVDGGATWNEVEMTGSEPNFSGSIPGQSPGTDVLYYVEATDVEGLVTTTTQVFYSVFLAQNPALLVYDDATFGIGTIQAFWMRNLPPDSTGTWPEWGYDVWLDTYGPISTELIENYQQIYHVMGGGPTNQPANPYPGNIYKAWFDQASAETPRNLFLSGQDYGFISGFADTTFPVGTFERDILGVETLGPQDLNYDGTAASYQTAYAVDAVQDDPLTGWMVDLDTDTTFLAYDPYFELGINNWIDNMTLDGGTAIMTDPATEGVVAARNEGENWHATFWALDPVGLGYFTNADSSEAIWIAGVENPAVPVFNWFGNPVVGLEDISNGTTPETYTLRQNYPNPFNPTTKIEFSVPKTQQVVLKVFDITGREVATLINDKIVAGEYSVEFNASNLASGLYVYTVEAGSFRDSKKMLLVK